MGLKFKFWRFLVTRFFKRLLPTLVCIATIATIGVGCATHDGDELRVLPQIAQLGLDHGHRSDVPLDSVREDFRTARAQDRTLELAFYEVPISFANFGSDSKPFRVETSSDTLVDRLKSKIEPHSWVQPGRRAFIEGQWLVVFQPAGAQAQIADWIEKEREEATSKLRLVTIEIRTLTIPKTVDVGTLSGVTRAASSENQFIVSDAGWSALQSLDPIEQMAAPRVTAFEGQRANVTVVNQIAYVKDFETYTVERETVSDPIVDVLNEGLTVDLLARFVEENRISVTLDVSVAELLGWDKTTVTPPGTTGPIEIDLPEVRVAQTECTLELEPGQGMLVRSLSNTAPDGREFWISVTAREASH